MQDEEKLSLQEIVDKLSDRLANIDRDVEGYVKTLKAWDPEMRGSYWLETGAKRLDESSVARDVCAAALSNAKRAKSVAQLQDALIDQLINVSAELRTERSESLAYRRSAQRAAEVARIFRMLFSRRL